MLTRARSKAAKAGVEIVFETALAERVTCGEADAGALSGVHPRIPGGGRSQRGS
jgi:hypothetical protein